MDLTINPSGMTISVPLVNTPSTSKTKHLIFSKAVSKGFIFFGYRAIHKPKHFESSPNDLR